MRKLACLALACLMGSGAVVPLPVFAADEAAQDATWSDADYNALYVQEGLTFYWDGSVTPVMNGTKVTAIPDKSGDLKITHMATDRQFTSIVDMGTGFTYDAAGGFIRKSDGRYLIIGDVLPTRTVGEATALADVTVEVLQSYPTNAKATYEGDRWNHLGFPSMPSAIAGNAPAVPVAVPGYSLDGSTAKIVYSAPLRGFDLGGTKLDYAGTKGSALFYNSRKLGSAFTTTITYDFSGEDVSKLAYELTLSRDGVDMASKSGTYVNDAAVTRDFNEKQMSYGVDFATEYYAIRVYNRVLTESERQQNHFVDLAMYFGADLRLFSAMDKSAKEAVYAAFAGYDTATLDEAGFKLLLADMIAGGAADAETLVNSVISPDFTDLIRFEGYQVRQVATDTVKAGIRALYTVNTEAPMTLCDGKIVITEVGALMKMAAKETAAFSGYSALNGISFTLSETVDELVATESGTVGVPVLTDGVAAVAFYRDGAWDEAHLIEEKSAYAFTTVLSDSEVKSKEYLETDFLYRGYVKYTYGGNTYISYTDMGDNFGTGISLYTASTYKNGTVDVYAGLNESGKLIANGVIGTVITEALDSMTVVADTSVSTADAAVDAAKAATTAGDSNATLMTSHAGNMTTSAKSMQTQVTAMETAIGDGSAINYVKLIAAYKKYMTAKANFDDYSSRFVACNPNAKPDFSGEITRTSDAIKRFQTDKTFTFTVFSDIHTHPDSVNSQKLTYTLDTIKSMNEQSSIQANFYLGDTALVHYGENAAYPESYWTQELIDAEQKRIYDGMHEISPNSFMLVGNHDGARAGYAAAKDFYDVCVKPMETVELANGAVLKTETNQGYYYIDYPTYNLRVLCLMATEKTETNTWYIGYDGAQLQWIADALVSAGGKDILIMSHIAPRYEENSYGTANFAPFRAMMMAYAAGENYSAGGVTGNFAEANRGKPVGMFVGHGHYDRIKTWDDFPCPVIEIQGAGPAESVPSCVGSYITQGVNGTYTMVCWDTVVYNPETRELQIIRFGAGADRYVKLSD